MKMLGKSSRYSPCTCCSDDTKKRARRSQRRRERQVWKNGHKVNTDFFFASSI